MEVEVVVEVSAKEIGEDSTKAEKVDRNNKNMDMIKQHVFFSLLTTKLPLHNHYNIESITNNEFIQLTHT